MPRWCWSPSRNAAPTSGRVRMAVIPDFKATTLTAFIKQHVAPGSTIYTDGLKQFTGLPVAGFRHVRAHATAARRAPQGCQVGRAAR